MLFFLAQPWLNFPIPAVWSHFVSANLKTIPSISEMTHLQSCYTEASFKFGLSRAHFPSLGPFLQLFSKFSHLVFRTATRTEHCSDNLTNATDTKGQSHHGSLQLHSHLWSCRLPWAHLHRPQLPVPLPSGHSVTPLPGPSSTDYLNLDPRWILAPLGPQWNNNEYFIHMGSGTLALFEDECECVFPLQPSLFIALGRSSGLLSQQAHIDFYSPFFMLT